MDMVTRKAELTELWTDVRLLLNDAAQHLPAYQRFRDAPSKDSSKEKWEEGFRQFWMFLDHNELELAWDTLAELGERANVAPDYWRNLSLAAERMHLQSKHEMAAILANIWSLRNTWKSSTRYTDEALPTSQHIAAIAQVSPRAAVLEAWLVVEREIAAAVRRLGIAPLKGRLSLNRQLELLQSAEQIDELTMHALKAMASLRNRVVHYGSIKSLDYFSAMAYWQAAVRLLDILRPLQPRSEAVS